MPDFRPIVTPSIRRYIWINAALYFIFCLLSLNAWSAIDIFLFERYETKFGGPWENFVLGWWLTLAISMVSSGGYLVVIQAFGRWLFDGVSAKRAIVAALAAAMFLALAGTGVVAMFELLPFNYVVNLVLAFFLAGVIVGGVAMFIAWLFTRAWRTT